VPIELTGRQAVDEHFQIQALGSILWTDACRKVANAGTALAAFGIVMQTKTPLLRIFIGISRPAETVLSLVATGIGLSYLTTTHVIIGIWRKPGREGKQLYRLPSICSKIRWAEKHCPPDFERWIAWQRSCRRIAPS